MKDRTVARTTIKGTFGLPMGITFLGKDQSIIHAVEVSTVDLENFHLEDPLKICSPEHGFETMVFPGGCTFFPLYTAQYKTRLEAEKGHTEVVEKIRSGELPLAISLGKYYTWE